MIDDGKKELFSKRKNEVEGKHFENPYERLVYKVHLR